MKLSISLRSGLLLGAAAFALAACDGDSNVENAGDTGAVTINIGNQGGGGASGGDGAVSFVPAGGCATGTTEGSASVNGVTATLCFLGSTAPTASGSVTTSTVTANGNNIVITGTDTVLSGVVAFSGNIFVGENTISDNDLNGNGTSSETGTLTLEPGTILVSTTNAQSTGTPDTLLVSPGSQLIADGTANEPIIMTTLADLADADAATDRSALEAASDGLVGGSEFVVGQWGGIVINGNAPINDCEDATLDPVASPELCFKDGEGGSGLFGGDQPTDNSGILDYVRVQYAGFGITADDELNGIAFQGVGNGTQVSNIQVHNNDDDGVEFFGGTVNATNVVITGAGDDSIDWTDGWTGSIQFALVVQTNTPATNRGLEGDNRNGDNAIEPASDPAIANFTFLTNFVGATPTDADDGIKLRRGSLGTLANGIVANFAGTGFDYDEPTAGQDSGNDPAVLSTYFGGNVGGVSDSAGDAIIDADPNNVRATGTTLNGIFSGPDEQAVTPADVSGLGLSNVDYIGAFADTVQSISSSWLAGWALTNGIPGGDTDSCPTGTTLSTRAVPSGRTEAAICDLPDVITSDLRLVRGFLYEVSGNSTFVGIDAGPDPMAPLANSESVDLTIDAGVTVFGTEDAGGLRDNALIVTRGSRLFSNGTSTNPVVFTSLEDLQGMNTASTVGQWGGIVINGRAPINDCDDPTLDPTVSAGLCFKEGEGGSGLFGGNVSDDNSGRLVYTSVRYAGFGITADDELNGIAFQGVGNGTEVDFVEVYNNDDDGVEFFGGTVNAKHLVIVGAGDDSIDWTDGWIGNVQYAIVVQTDTPATNRGIEGDNRNGDNDIEPQSNPWLSNLTFTTTFSTPPTDADDGIKLRRGTVGRISNAVVVNFNGTAFDYDEPSAGQDLGNDPVLVSVFEAGNSGGAADSDGNPIFTAGSSNNVSGTDAVLLPDTDGSTVPLLPNTEIDAMTVDATDRGQGFFDAVDYVGAVRDDADNWYVGWTFGLDQ
ncbi:MAG: hypothetical protein AAF788_01970 [Pseudomonadota bacterium]